MFLDECKNHLKLEMESIIQNEIKKTGKKALPLSLLALQMLIKDFIQEQNFARMWELINKVRAGITCLGLEKNFAHCKNDAKAAQCFLRILIDLQSPTQLIARAQAEKDNYDITCWDWFNVLEYLSNSKKYTEFNFVINCLSPDKLRYNKDRCMFATCLVLELIAADHLDEVEILLQKGIGTYGTDALFAALNFSHFKLIPLLLQSGSEVTIPFFKQLHNKRNTGSSVVQFFAKHDQSQAQAVEAMVKHGLLAKLISAVTYDNVEEGVADLKMLLDNYKVDMSAKFNEGMSPLHFMASHPDECLREVHNCLIKAGADVHEMVVFGEDERSYRLPLFHYVMRRAEEICNSESWFFYFMDSVNLCQPDEYGRNLWYVLAEPDREFPWEVPLLDLLKVDKNFDLNSAIPNADNQGNSKYPLHYAIENRQWQLVVKVLERSFIINVEQCDAQGRTPLALALQVFTESAAWAKSLDRHYNNRFAREFAKLCDKFIPLANALLVRGANPQLLAFDADYIEHSLMLTIRLLIAQYNHKQLTMSTQQMMQIIIDRMRKLPSSRFDNELKVDVLCGLKALNFDFKTTNDKGETLLHGVIACLAHYVKYDDTRVYLFEDIINFLLQEGIDINHCDNKKKLAMSYLTKQEVKARVQHWIDIFFLEPDIKDCIKRA